MESSQGMSASQPDIHIRVFLVTSRLTAGSAIRDAVKVTTSSATVISGLSIFAAPPKVNRITGDIPLTLHGILKFGTAKVVFPVIETGVPTSDVSLKLQIEPFVLTVPSTMS